MKHASAVAALLLAVACGNDAPAPPPAASAVASAAPVSPEAVELDALLRGLALCKLDERGEIDRKCDAGAAFTQWLRGHAKWLAEPTSWEAAKPFVDQPGPAVRAGAIGVIVAGAKAGHRPAQDVLLVRVTSERELPLLALLVRSLGKVPDAPALRAAAAGATRHPEAMVRRAAVNALARPTTPPPPGPEREALLALLASDPDASLRRLVCWQIGIGEEADILAAIVRVLDDDKTPAALYDDCTYGLALAWDPKIPKPSRIAYTELLARLERGPRDATHPLGGAIGQMTYLDGASTAALPFYEPERVLRAVRNIAKDRAAHEDSRAAAVGLLLHQRPDDLGIPLEEAKKLVDARLARSTQADAGP